MEIAGWELQQDGSAPESLAKEKQSKEAHNPVQRAEADAQATEEACADASVVDVVNGSVREPDDASEGPDVTPSGTKAPSVKADDA